MYGNSIQNAIHFHALMSEIYNLAPLSENGREIQGKCKRNAREMQSISTVNEREASKKTATLKRLLSFIFSVFKPHFTGSQLGQQDIKSKELPRDVKQSSYKKRA